MNNNEPKRRMSTEEKLIHYQGLREENAKLINMREAAVKESEKLQREVKNLTETNSKLNDALAKQFAVANDAIMQNEKLSTEKETALKEIEMLREKVKTQSETNLKFNDALIDQSIKAYDSNARSEELNNSMKKWIKLHDLKAKENIELKAKVHTLEARDIDNQKEIEWQKDQKNILREKLEDLRKNPTSILRNCMVWDKDGVKRYNENGLISVGMSIDGNLTMDYSALPINSIGALKSGSQPKPKYVYAILPYPNHKDIILYRNLDKALEVLKKCGAAKGHNVIMYPLEIEE